MYVDVVVVVIWYSAGVIVEYYVTGDGNRGVCRGCHHRCSRC